MEGEGSSSGGGGGAHGGSAGLGGAHVGSAGLGGAHGGSAALDRVEWSAETGDETFAVPSTHEDLVRHFSALLLRGCPETEQGSGKHQKSASQTFCENVEAFGLPAMKEENEDKKTFEEYAAQAGYMCQTCMDRRHLVVRPPFESMALLRWTSRVTCVPDNAGQAFRVVFTAIQRDRLVACGYEVVTEVRFHMPSDRLSDFQPRRQEEPQKKRRVVVPVAAAAAGQESAATGGAPLPVYPDDGPGVDTLVLPAQVPTYSTPQELCDIIEKGFYLSPESGFQTPLYRWPSTKDKRRTRFLQQHPRAGTQAFESYNDTFSNRLKEYYNLISRHQEVWAKLPQSYRGPDTWPSADHLQRQHDSFATRRIHKESLRLPLPRKHSLFALVTDTVKAQFSQRSLIFKQPFD